MCRERGGEQGALCIEGETGPSMVCEARAPLGC